MVQFFIQTNLYGTDIFYLNVKRVGVQCIGEICVCFKFQHKWSALLKRYYIKINIFMNL